ncbi:hypothetical protein ACFLSZ_01690 [Candidatus Bipolaricaulota bacterium]
MGIDMLPSCWDSEMIEFPTVSTMVEFVTCHVAATAAVGLSIGRAVLEDE